MGKLEVKGYASRTVDYDRMKMKLSFRAKELTPKKASEKVMQECEDFLAILKKKGVEIKGISLSSDSVDQTTDFRTEEEYYVAHRVLEIESEFDMKAINRIRAVVNSSNAEAEFKVDFSYSEVEKIGQELMTEALKDAKAQAEIMAASIDQKVIGLISADKNDPRSASKYDGEIMCLCTFDEFDEVSYDNSDELSASNTTYSESIFTVWEIG